MKRIPYNSSFRNHLNTGIITSVWLVIFLILIAPFDASDLTLWNRILLLPTYGFLYLITYMIIWPIQEYWFKSKGYWNIGMEASVIFLSYVINLFLTFSYYKTSMVNGTYSFIEFTVGVYLPIIVVISLPLLVARYYYGQKDKSANAPISTKQILRGDNRDDILQVSLEHIICISSAQNYVEVHYIHDGHTKKKLLRSTLKNLHAQVPTFLQSHRSHIFNPEHFVKWDGSKQILVGNRELPVSKKYKQNIEASYESVPNL